MFRSELIELQGRLEDYVGILKKLAGNHDTAASVEAALGDAPVDFEEG